MRLRVIAIVAAMLAVVGVGTAHAAPRLALPRPGGVSPVGTTAFHFTDTSRAALGAVALLSACSGQNSAATASNQSALVNVAAKSQVQQPETPVKKGGGGASAEDVNCSTLGGPDRSDRARLI